MKKVFIILLLIAPFWCLAQQSVPDTVLLPQISVKSDRNLVYTSGSRTTLLDSAGNPFRAKNITELLEQNTAVFVKSNGAGGSATITTRGTEARHNAVLWHGFNLNSATLGVSDLSLISSSTTGNITFLHGGSAAVNGNSAIGSVLLLENSLPSFYKSNNTRINLELGSFGNYHGTLKSSLNNKLLNSTTSLYFDKVDNNYEYTNIARAGHPKEKQEHAAYSNFGVIQDFAVKLASQQVLYAGIWYQVTNRDIPSLMVVPESFASQADSNLRIHAGYTLDLKNSALTVKGAYFNDHQKYNDDKFDLHTRYDVKNYFGEVNWNYDAGGKIIAGLGAAYNDARADFSEYGMLQSRAVTSLFGNLKYRFASGWNTGISVRQEFSNISNPPFAPYFTLDGNLFRYRFFISAQAGRHFSLPSMNDLYWIPGGNPDLKPENGWTESVSLIYRSNEKLPEVTATVYNSVIDNWIKWQPGSSGYYVAQNLDEVHAYGAEFLIRYHFTLKNFTGKLNGSYAYTRSALSENNNGENSGAYNKQLIYVPEKMWNVNFSLLYKSWSLHYNTTYTGKRYTTADNDRYLDGYYVAGLAVEKQFTAFKTPFGIYFRIANLYDASYQVMAWYPAPGRSFNAGFRADLVYKSKKTNKTN